MITVDEKHMEIMKKLFKNLKNNLPTVLMRAINRAAESAKTNTGKKASEKYVIKTSDVKSTVKITKATTQKLRAIVTSTGFKVPLYKFKASPSVPRTQNPPRAYKFKVKKSGSLKPITGAFIASLNGNRAMKRVDKNRLPIKQLYGPSIPEMLGNKSVSEAIENEAQKVLEKRFEHEIKRVMR